MRVVQGVVVAVGLLLLSGGSALSRGNSEAKTPVLDFARDIRPILATRCWGCHGPSEQKGSLRLDSRAALLKGGASGPALHPTRSADSELIRRVAAADATLLMPPGKALSAREVNLLRAWIDAGAPWSGSQPSAAAAPATHWAFLPPKPPLVPQVQNPESKIQNPIDAFVLARLPANRRTLGPEADRHTLLRRVTLDLTGLPPSPEEIAAFTQDRSPDAYEKVARRLLASPRYGERWAQHWLDVVRFAETNGYEADGNRPQAWRYRDWVVRALNADMPYDRFLQYQVAGDLLEPDSFDAVVATGFLRTGPEHVVGGNQDRAMLRQEWLTETVANVGNGILGLTVQCARCHDHKYDPIPQADYYRLQAFFAGSANHEYPKATAEEKAANEAALRTHRERLAPVRAELAVLEEPYHKRLRDAKMAKLEPQYRAALEVPVAQRTPEQARLAQDAGVMLKIEWTELLAALTPEDRERRAALRRRMHAIEAEVPPPLPAASGVADLLSPVPATHVLLRGDLHTPGPVVEPAFPSALVAGAVQPGDAAKPAGACEDTPQRGRRLALARWLTQPEHPLTARVMVNRVWQHHFGRGLVATPNDFGKNGTAPTYPELLDWLAATFVAVQSPEARVQRQPSSKTRDSGLRTQDFGLNWSLKALHYLIVTSAVYREAYNPQSAIRNPQLRMDAETLRDSILAVSGTLNEEGGGPSVRVPLEPEVVATIFTEGEPDNLWQPDADPRRHARRSLYLFRKRNVRLPMLAVFDAPDMTTSCAARLQSVHALQSLTLMNSDFMTEQSRAFARRILSGPEQETTGRLRHLHLLALGREASARELDAAHRFLKDQAAHLRERIARGEPVARLQGLPEGIDPAEAAAWADLCLATFNRNDFLYIR